MMTGPLNREAPRLVEGRVAEAIAALRTELKDWSDDDFAAHVARGTPSYWLSVDPVTAARHARLARRAQLDGAPLSVETRVDPPRGVTELTIHTGDHPGLFAGIAGAMAVSGANIVDAKIFTLADGMALDVFWLQDAEGGAFDRPEKLARLAVLIEQSLSGRLRSLDELKHRRSGPTRARVFTVTPRVLIDNEVSATHTVVEVNGRDRPGLLYEVTSAMTALQLQIATAKISTFGERVVDVFYVKNIFGLKVDHATQLVEIRDSLTAVLADPDQPAAEAPEPRRGRGVAAE
jgi:[protein-PII] uridylyltransferase